MQLVQIRQIPADCAAERVLHVQVVEAGRRETTREKERERETRGAMRQEGRMRRTYVGRLHT